VKISIVLSELGKNWIIEKIALKLRDALSHLGVSLRYESGTRFEILEAGLRHPSC
jgi:hypothetical protein